MLKIVFCRGLEKPFENGGRLYTSTYKGIQNINKILRNYIYINNESTVELDYTALHINMLYAKENIKYDEDPYESVFSDNEKLRPLVKVLFLIAINSKNESETKSALQSKINKGEFDYLFDVKEKRKNININNLLNKIKEIHKPIMKYLSSDYGVKLQNQDGKIMLDILLKCTDNNIFALPVHDSCIVQTRHKNQVKQIMKDTYFKHMGFNCPVEEK